MSIKDIILAVDTSTRAKRFLVFRGKELQYSSEFLDKIDIATTFASEVKRSFEKLNISFSDIAALAVNVGPGALSSTRCGVTFINAISFASGIPIIKYSHMEALGAEAWVKEKKPVLCIQNIADNKYIYGVYNNKKFDLIGVAKAAEISQSIAKNFGNAVLATNLKRIDEFITPAIRKSTITFASTESVHSLILERWKQKQFTSNLAEPITETLLEIRL